MLYGRIPDRPDSKKISGRIIRPDSDYIKANTAHIIFVAWPRATFLKCSAAPRHIFRECMTEAENYIPEKGAIVLTERKIGKSRIDKGQSKALRVKHSFHALRKVDAGKITLQ